LFFCSSLGECRILVEQGEGQMKNCKFALWLNCSTKGQCKVFILPMP
jgi:hypothetical protein